MTERRRPVSARFLVSLLVAPILLLSSGALADDGPPKGESPASTLRLARAAEEKGDIHRALALYEAVVNAGPSSRLAARATDRLRWLSERSEGEFAPLMSLLRFRNQADHRSPERLAAFAKELETFPPGRVRREARALVANAWLSQPERTQNAMDMFEAWAAEPDLEPAEVGLAAGGSARARAILGDVSGGLQRLKEAGMVGQPELRRMRWEVAERVALPTAWTLLGLYFVAATIAVLRARHAWKSLLSGLNPGWLLVAAWVVVLPPTMASAHDYTLLPLVPDFALVAAALAIVARLAGAGLATSAAPAWQRRGLAGLAFVAVISAGVLAAGESDLVDHLQLWWGI